MSKRTYDITYQQGEDIKNIGYDYENYIMSKTTSNYLFRNNVLSGFLTYINNILFVYIEAVKKIRVNLNYNVPKDYTKIN